MLTGLLINILSGQGSTLNTLADTDDYTVLRSIATSAFDNSESNLKYGYRLYGDTKKFIKYFIGSKSFSVKSDIDIYNNLIYADLDKDGLVTPYQFASGRLDSIYLLSEKLSPQSKYLYYPKDDLFGKVIDQGRYSIVEALLFEFQKGNINPVIDLGSFEDKIIINKVIYLIDSGIWYMIPKNKNDLVKFIQLHFKRKIEKGRLKGKRHLDVLIDLN